MCHSQLGAQRVCFQDREVLGRGAKGSPLLTKGQERFLVMGLVGQGGAERSP